MNSETKSWFFMDGRFYGGIAVGVIALAALGFNWIGGYGFGWIFGSEARQVADQAVEKRLAEICVARAHQDPNAESAIAALKKESSWSRGKFVSERGWATMPPSDAPDSAVADLCAENLLESSR